MASGEKRGGRDEETAKQGERAPSAATIQRWLRDALGLKPMEAPFPWQLELLARFVRGEVPRALDLPTGLGKTAVMAIWLVARACGASLPRRLVYVVDRHAVVDQSSAVAVKLRELVAADVELAAALGLPGKTLPISTLRGQFVDNREWLTDPAAPAIVVGTVDMVGSRLLFEGYGVSRRMRPYQAGLLGADTLLVLDEAHLVPPFEKLIEQITDGGAEFGAKPADLGEMLPPLRLISLSATGRARGATFSLSTADREHPIVRKRLDATKRLVVRDAIDPDVEALPVALAREAWELAERGGRPMRCLIFCDKRGDAEKTDVALRALAAGDKRGNAAVEIETELFVGGRRVHEREEAASWLQERGFIAGQSARPSKPTFVIATAAGEVGVDLDADHLVADAVAWERMVQRLGRVNRRGEGDATVVVVPTLPDKETRGALAKDPEARDDKEAGLARRFAMCQAALETLQELTRAGDTFDASPGSITLLKQRAAGDGQLHGLIERASTPEPLRPCLTRRVLEAWSMTSLREHTGRPEVQPWLRGWVDDDPQTTIVWRACLPVTRAGASMAPSDVAEFFEAAPPHMREKLEIESYRVVDWLFERIEAIKADVEAAIPEALEADEVNDRTPALRLRDVVAFILSPDDAQQESLNGYGLLNVSKGERRDKDQLLRKLYGATLVVDLRMGGLSSRGLLDGKANFASDIGETPDRLPFRVRSVASERATVADVASWREELRLDIEVDEDGTASQWLVVESRRDAMASSENGRSTTPARAQLLVEHEQWTERFARDLALRLALPEHYTEVLALAARLHDEGKKARIWQRAFHAPPDGPWAKTTSRPNQALLDGYRHELGSLPYAERDERVAALEGDLRDLCLHLIAAHHGFARPVIGTAGCEDAPPSALVARAQTIALRFARLEKRWGPWGLAWWEALLRAADQQASRENDERGGGRG